TLERLIRERGDDYASLSRLLGRNAAYVQQFIRRGVPRKLDEGDRRTLARYFGVAEEALGGPPPQPGGASRTRGSGFFAVPKLALGASAGPGAVPGDERAQARIGFEAKWLREMSRSPDALSLIRVTGDSMAPTLADGDDILVDRSDAGEQLRDGIYVLRIDDALNVKRIAVTPGRRFTILSDNSAYPPLSDWTPDQVAVIGRVVWVGRRVS
ncbi:MAG: S24 family peptidase, partial [Sphingomonadaceae bacterium]|nr:S24 family peptidase [Sphingomonadaceae bacterium]